ncbi:MAG: hypothetical protein HQL54_00335 [Magnetococcales bacterium]|nr:hypothetical protein [Magnetococcales bacterium]
MMSDPAAPSSMTYLNFDTRDQTRSLSAPTAGEQTQFESFLDTVNPMQHLPVVSGIYRKQTGDGIEAGPKLAGSALYGFLMGGPASSLTSVASAGADVLVKEISGRDLTEHALELVGAGAPPPPKVMDFQVYTGSPINTDTVYGSGQNGGFEIFSSPTPVSTSVSTGIKAYGRAAENHTGDAR